MTANNFRILIDGYNLIFQCGLEGKRRSPVTIEKARDRLVSTLKNRLCDQERKQIAIVFDATKLPIKETEKVSVREEMTIYFSVDFDDADSMIEEMIRTNSNPKQLLVVSSDHRMHKAALRRKATPIDSDVWFDQVEQTGESDTDFPESNKDEDREKSLPDSFADIDWFKEFGVDD